jgi:aminoglycoside phosphotransferase (APT) family kinase protein
VGDDPAMDAETGGPQVPHGAPQAVPPATGLRLDWADTPAWLRDEVEERLGGRVVEAVTQPGGFSPGLAVRLRLADGRRAFVKAVGPDPNPDSAAIHRSEARTMAALPRSAPAPRLLWSLDRHGWVALAFEDVGGVHPTLPWRPGELRRVLDMAADLAATPAPPGLPPVAERLQDTFTGWRDLAAIAADDDLAGLDPWAVRHLRRLAGLEAGWPAATAGRTLLHLDLRADNLLLTPTRVVAVDWPYASVGAAWVDLALLLPSVTMQGGPDPEPTFAAHPVAAGADPEAVTATLAAFTGFLLSGARLPPPPGLPTLRAFQLGQGVVALEWLRLRTGWD